MKRKGTIPVLIYAEHDYTTRAVRYYAQSMDDETEQAEEEFGNALVGTTGIFGGREKNGDLITWAQNPCESIENLIKTIKKGSEENSLPTLQFFFDYPENLYTDVKLNNGEDNVLWHGRPLSPMERAEFIKGYASSFITANYK